MAWRVANSLNVLLDQLNALAPGRNKASDGSIGDVSHQNRTSDHNPWYPPPNGGIVTARDFTHDPARLSMHWVADTLTAHRDPRIKYIIWNRRIWNPSTGWRAYSGVNPHTSHLHLSVVASPACDSTALWAGFVLTPPPKDPEVELTDEMAAFFPGPWPQWVRDQNVGETIANMFSYMYNTAPKVDAANATANEAKIAANAANSKLDQLLARPVVDVEVGASAVVDELIARGVTGGASKDEVDQVVRAALNSARLATN